MKPEKTKYPGVYRIGKRYFIDYYGPDGKRHREVAGSKLSDAVGRKEEIKEQIRKGRYFAERKKYTATFDELIQKYREIYKDQRSFKTAKVSTPKVLENQFKGRLLSQITPFRHRVVQEDEKRIHHNSNQEKRRRSCDRGYWENKERRLGQSGTGMPFSSF